MINNMNKKNKFLITLIFLTVILVAGSFTLKNYKVGVREKQLAAVVSGIKQETLNVKNAIASIRSSGKEIEVEGRLEIEYHENLDLKTGYEQYYINSNEERIRIYFNEEQLPQIKNFGSSGSKVVLKVSGKSANSNKNLSGEREIAADKFEVVSNGPLNGNGGGVIASAEGREPWNPITIGNQKIALILYNMGPDNITPQSAASTLQSTLNSFWRWVSYGKLSVSVDGYGPYGGGCNASTYIRSAINAASREIYYPDYNSVFVLTAPGACGTAPGVHTGAGPSRFSLNGQDVYLSTVHLTGSFALTGSTPMHEFGHSLGLGHTPDKLDIMSYSGVKGLNAVSRDELGWLDESNVIEINEQNKLNYFELSPLENKSTDLKVLRVPTKISYRENTLSYYISYRPSAQGCADKCQGFMININYPVEVVDADPLDIFSLVLKAGQTYHDPDPMKGILISAIEENGKLKVTFGLAHCGNGSIDAGEECDQSNLGWRNTCESIGFESGNLKCSAQCKFDTPQCENRVCGIGDERSGKRECKRSFISDLKDNVVYSSEQLYNLDNSINQETWNKLRYTTEKTYVGIENALAYYFGLFSNYSSPPTALNPIRRDFIVPRAYIPFNTGSLPDSLMIVSGNILFHVFGGGIVGGVVNSNPNSKDFLTLVSIQPEDPPNLKNNDFLKFGEVDNPVELGNRFDASTDYDNSNREILFELNKEGRKNINPTGFSNFGIRSGYDLENEIPNNGESTQLLFWIKSSNPELTGVYEPPTLNLIYKVPFFSFIKNKENTAIQGLLILKVEKKNGEQWDVEKVVSSENVSVPAGAKIDLNNFWKIEMWKPSSVGIYRIDAEFKVGDKSARDIEEFAVAGENCGNTKIDSGEVCDDEIIGQYRNGVGQCKVYDVNKYTAGDLKCNNACLDYDFSACVSRSGRSCLTGDIDNRDGTCTATFNADPRDGFFTSRNDNRLGWNDLKNVENANYFDNTSSKLEASSVTGATLGSWTINRGLILFNTEKLNEESVVLSAKLKLRTKEVGYVNQLNYHDDFISLTGINIDNPSNISLATYGKFGDVKLVDADKVLRLRGLPKNREVEIQMNDSGLNNVNKNGWTNLGLRTGMEFDDEQTLSNLGYLNVSGQFYSANSSFKPKLEIVYAP